MNIEIKESEHIKESCLSEKAKFDRRGFDMEGYNQRNMLLPSIFKKVKFL